MSRLNPLTPVIGAERALFAGAFDAGLLLSGTAAAAGVCAVGLWVGTRSMQAADRGLQKRRSPVSGSRSTLGSCLLVVTVTGWGKTLLA